MTHSLLDNFDIDRVTRSVGLSMAQPDDTFDNTWMFTVFFDIDDTMHDPSRMKLIPWEMAHQCRSRFDAAAIKQHRVIDHHTSWRIMWQALILTRGFIESDLLLCEGFHLYESIDSVYQNTISMSMMMEPTWMYLEQEYKKSFMQQGENNE